MSLATHKYFNCTVIVQNMLSMCPPPFQEETGRPIEKERCIHVTEVYDMVVYVVFQTMNLSFSNLKMTEDALEGDQNDNIKRSVKSAGTCYRMIIL